MAKLKTYTVYASETLYYEFEVKARSLEEANQKAVDHRITKKDIDSSDHFEYDLVEEEN